MITPKLTFGDFLCDEPTNKFYFTKSYVKKNILGYKIQTSITKLTFIFVCILFNMFRHKIFQLGVTLKVNTTISSLHLSMVKKIEFSLESNSINMYYSCNNFTYIPCHNQARQTG